MKDLKKKIKREMEEILDDKEFMEETRKDAVKSAVIPAVALISSTVAGTVTALACKKIFKL